MVLILLGEVQDLAVVEDIRGFHGTPDSYVRTGAAKIEIASSTVMTREKPG
jgi:hypothetical protein